MIARIILGLSIVLAAPCVSFAADPVPGQAIIGTKDVLRGQFTDERHIAGFNGPMKSSGHFVVAPGFGLIWATDKPFATTSVITASGVVQDVGGDKVMKIPATQTPFLAHLYEMLGGVLAGNWQILEKDFDVVRGGDADHWQVDLTPHEKNNPAMPFSMITVKGSRFVEDALLLKPSGDSDDITFSNQAVAPAPPVATEMAAFKSVGP